MTISSRCRWETCGCESREMKRGSLPASRKCQRTRRRRWQRQKLKTDADYRANQVLSLGLFPRQSPKWFLSVSGTNSHIDDTGGIVVGDGANWDGSTGRVAGWTSGTEVLVEALDRELVARQTSDLISPYGSAVLGEGKRGGERRVMCRRN